MPSHDSAISDAQRLLQQAQAQSLSTDPPRSDMNGEQAALQDASAAAAAAPLPSLGKRAQGQASQLRGHFRELRGRLGDLASGAAEAAGGLVRKASHSPVPPTAAGGYPSAGSSVPTARGDEDDPPPGAACMCLPGPRGTPGQLLKRWRGTGGDEERALREFYDVMLGKARFDQLGQSVGTTRSSVLPQRGDDGRGISLAEFDLDMARALCAGRTWKSGDGIAHELRPYLEDQITRRQGLRGVVDLLAAAVDGDTSLPRVLAELSAKDVFVALLVSLPRRSRAHLVAAYVALRVPVPIVFRCPTSGGETRTVAAFEILQVIACVPSATRKLVVSVGTQKVARAGKTSLLAALGLVSVAEDDLDLSPCCGPTHFGSCDLLASDPTCWILDVHGAWYGADEELHAAVLALSVSGGAVCLVHCGLSDLHPKTGAPQRELASLLTALVSTKQASSSYPSSLGRCRGVIVLIRDASADAWTPRAAAVEAALRAFGVIATIPIDDCRSFKSAARRGVAMDRYRALVGAGIEKAELTEGLTTLNPREVYQVYREQLDGVSVPTTFGHQLMPLGGELVAHLDSATSTQSTFSTLFPLSALNRRLAALRREQVGSAIASSDTSGAMPKDGDVGASAGSFSHRSVAGSRLEQLRREENEAYARAEEISSIEQQISTQECSAAMHFFRKVVSATGADECSCVATELALHLEKWKEPLVSPLLERQRVLLDSKVARDSAADEDGEKDELAEVVAKIADLDFSMDSFWVELELLALRGTEPESEFSDAKLFWQSMLNDGQPFQLLHGRPLQIGGCFLRSVLESIGAPLTEADPRGIFVVSVIGAQSSAKSTLLNFLFGCNFAVSAGRCTRGLYASYFRPGGGHQPILVLDSEGLLSLGSEGGAFDGQIALMCMTCSNLVLVNNKGELSRQLQDLLEVSLFAMKHLRISRLQPRLVFVLRDQHDRSRAVHEDMLKQMRSHLEDSARTLGTPLKDLILLDGTAVSLLPSAVTSELRQGKEVCWTSELFAREVLQLRSEVFRWLHEDAAQRAAYDGTEPREFSSLAHWYDHASAAWDTLVQFGEQLLHYKTINEITIRRELADVAKVAIRDALDGAPRDRNGTENATHGFHSRARQMVDSFVTRILASPNRLDLDTIDMEFSRALVCLRDECVAGLEELFMVRAADPRFGVSAREQARQQLRTPIEWAYENHLYTWKLHLKKASDERAMHELWVHFTGVLNRHLATSGHRSSLSEDESHRLFNQEWSAYEMSYLTRLRSLTKDWQTLAHEATLVFNHAVAKLQHEAGALALLKEMGPQQVALPAEKRRAAGLASLLEQTDEEWEELYFHVGWWESMKARGLALLQNGGDASLDASGTLVGLRGVIIPRMRQSVEQGVQQFAADVRTRGALDEATAAEGLRHITCAVLQDMETRLLAECSVRAGSATLRRPQMLHALHTALRYACVEALVAIEDEKQRSAMEDLLTQKALVEEHFLLIVQTNKGDMERASNFATLYHRSLMTMLDNEVMQLAAEVRNQVLHEMPDPRKSSERAFQRSFGSHNWMDVLEYVIDQNAYLEKLYLTVFHQKKTAYVEKARLKLEKRVMATYRLLQEIAGRWSRKHVEESAGAGGEADTSVKDVVRGPAASAGAARSVRELKDFIVGHAERIPKTADKAEAHRNLAERLPATADFQVADPALFVEALQARVEEFITGPEISKRLSECLHRSLREQSLRAWALIRGCSERCPLCGSKCDCVGEHAHHHCQHHLFPAFHGWMDRTTGLPSFNLCLSAATKEGSYECKDGRWRGLEKYLREEHPSWLPFYTDQDAGSKDIQYLRAAWVNCREPLLEYYKPMTEHCPKEWIDLYESENKLTKADLEVAKQTIRKLRAHTWTPPDD